MSGMKLLLCLVLYVLGVQATAQNLLVNGDFESGELAPWTGGELWVNPSEGFCGRVGNVAAVANTITQSLVLIRR
jgi:hypothetical protein